MDVRSLQHSQVVDLLKARNARGISIVAVRRHRETADHRLVSSRSMPNYCDSSGSSVMSRVSKYSAVEKSRSDAAVISDRAREVADMSDRLLLIRRMINSSTDVIHNGSSGGLESRNHMASLSSQSLPAVTTLRGDRQATRKTASSTDSAMLPAEQDVDKQIMKNNSSTPSCDSGTPSCNNSNTPCNNLILCCDSSTPCDISTLLCNSSTPCNSGTLVCNNSSTMPTSDNHSSHIEVRLAHRRKLLLDC